MNRRLLAAVGAVALVLGAIAGSKVIRAGTPADGKHYGHVFVIMMENTGYRSLIGNPNAPWINRAVATYGVATSYYGVAHPSQPNYIAATSGLTGDHSNADQTLDVPNIVDQLESRGKTWKAYMQSYALCGGNASATVCGNELYVRKHNPFISYANVQRDPTRVAKIVDLHELEADLARGEVADYNWISPDQCHNMHGRGPASDACSSSHASKLIAAGDAFLGSWVGKIMASRAWQGNPVIFITWDESDVSTTGSGGFPDTRGCCGASPGGGHVLTVVISRSNHTARRSPVAYNHYALLRTIQDGWQLGCLGATCDTVNVPVMNDLVGK